MPKLKYPSTRMERIDRLGWAAGMSVVAHGIRIGIRINKAEALERLASHLPPCSEPSSEPVVDGLYSVIVANNQFRKGTLQYNLVYAEATRVARTLDLGEALDRLESHLQLVVAANSTESLFVHAGVVGWKGLAIVIPGRSFSGKTSLVAALLAAGAIYYSDEYAVFNPEGQVLPYPRMLSIREQVGQARRRCHPEELGASKGQSPLRVGLVVMTEYQPAARWLPRSLSPGETLLALLENTVAARSQPAYALGTLQQVVTHAKAIMSKRGEAADITSVILNNQKVW